MDSPADLLMFLSLPKVRRGSAKCAHLSPAPQTILAAINIIDRRLELARLELEQRDLTGPGSPGRALGPAPRGLWAASVWGAGNWKLLAELRV